MVLAGALVVLGCAATPKKSESIEPVVTVDAGATVGATDAGAPANERPFAGSTADATELISRAVDGKHDAIAKCTQAFRVRRKLPHDKIAVSFGIDQEGHILGVTSKGKEDAELKACVLRAVSDAPFPRSHAGVITITKSYEEILVP